MQRILSVLVLCGLLLSSYFAQSANASTWKNPVTFHADSQQQGNHNYHKSLIFSEISSESEDSEQKFSSETSFADFQIFFSENRYIKNTLRVFTINYISKPEIKTSTPVFIIYRSIII